MTLSKKWSKVASGRNSVVFVVGALMSFSLFAITAQRVDAYTTADIIAKVAPTERDIIADYDNSATSPCITPAPTKQEQTVPWLSPAGQPNTEGPITVPYGATSANLQLNELVYLCHTLVAGQPHFPTDGTNNAPLVRQAAYLDSASSTVGSVTGFPAGGTITMNRDKNTRYWFADSAPNLTLNAPAGGFTSSIEITVNVSLRVWNEFNGGVVACVTGGSPNGPQAQGYGCQTGTKSYKVQINVSSTPPEGAVEASSCSGAKGYAFDRDDLNNPVIFRLYIHGAFAGQNEADIPRPDVDTVFGVTGNHGWSVGAFDTFPQFNPLIANGVEVRAVDQQTGAETSIGTFTVGPCVSAACGSNTFPASMAVGTVQTFTVSPTINYGYGLPYVRNVDPVLHVSVTDPSGAQVPIGPASYAVPDGGKTLSSNAFTFTPTNAGNYSLTYSLTGSVSVSCGPGSPAGGAPPSIASNQPYFHVDGGNIVAGAAFSNASGACTPTANAKIRGFNAGAANNWQGSGSQLAAIAQDQIQEVPSANNSLGGGSSGVVALTGKGDALSFANTGATAGFLGTVPCVPDYAGAAAGGQAPVAAGGVVDLGSYASGTTQTVVYSGSITVRGRLKTNTHVTIVVQGGNATVADTPANPITGATAIPGIIYGSYNLLRDAPQFKLLVSGGDIRILPGVTEMHGFYDAQASSTGVGGTVYTCYTGIEIDSTQCGTPTVPKTLTVYGAVAATNIKLQRTGGNIIGTPSSAGVPAEHFVYTPELWAATTNPSISGNQTIQVDAVTSLPPVL